MREIPAGCCNRREVRRARRYLLSRLAGIGPLAQLLSKTLMALLLLCRRQLHREIEEAVGIPLRVALDETYELLR